MGRAAWEMSDESVQNVGIIEGECRSDSYRLLRVS